MNKPFKWSLIGLGIFAAVVLVIVIQIIFKFELNYWQAITAIFTEIMALAIIASASIAFQTIEATKNIEEGKLDFKKKSIAKNLLLETNVNNFILDYLAHEVKITEYKFTSYKEIKHIKNFYEKLKFKFHNRIYNIFLEKAIDVDFNDKHLSALLWSYYEKLDLLNTKINLYNSVKLDEETFNFKKYVFDQVKAIVDLIKKKKLDKKIFKELTRESNYKLEDIKEIYKEFDLSQTDMLNELVKIAKDVKTYKKER